MSSELPINPTPSRASYTAIASSGDTARSASVPAAAAAPIRLTQAEFVIDDSSPSGKTYTAQAIVAAGESAGYRVRRSASQGAGAPAAQVASYTAIAASTAVQR